MGSKTVTCYVILDKLLKLSQHHLFFQNGDKILCCYKDLDNRWKGLAPKSWNSYLYIPFVKVAITHKLWGKDGPQPPSQNHGTLPHHRWSTMGGNWFKIDQSESLLIIWNWDRDYLVGLGLWWWEVSGQPCVCWPFLPLGSLPTSAKKTFLVERRQTKTMIREN